MAIAEDEEIPDLKIPQMVDKLDPFVQEWSDDDISQVVDFLKDWNTNSRFAFVSQAVITSLLRVHKNEKLRNIKLVSSLFEGLNLFSSSGKLS